MRRFLKWAGIGLGALVGLVVVAAGVMYAVGSGKVSQTYTVRTAQLTLPTDSASLARGAHLTRTMGCVDCHGQNLGGQVFEDIPPFRAVAANLTSGRGGVAGRSAEDLDRAIRHGVKPDGRSVIIMPSAAFHGMSDDDAAALIAYLKSAPPVDNELPPTEVRIPGRILAAGMMDPAAEVRLTPARGGTRPPMGPTLAYGEYLSLATCAHCHGPDLRGRATGMGAPGAPPPPDVVAAAQRWTPEQFDAVLRTGRTPEGRELDPKFMPWTMTAAMHPDERVAIRLYVASLASRAPSTAGR